MQNAFDMTSLTGAIASDNDNRIAGCDSPPSDSVDADKIDKQYRTFEEVISMWEWHDFDDVEALSEYVEGGYAPIRLGDELNNGHYKIRGKLGYGSSAIVWLAQDTSSSSYVAVKVFQARRTDEALKEVVFARRIAEYELTPAYLDSFQHTSANGDHMCSVWQVMGPTLNYIGGSGHIAVNAKQRRSLLQDLAQKLEIMHEQGISVSDLKPSNLVFELATDLEPNFFEKAVAENYAGRGGDRYEAIKDGKLWSVTQYLDLEYSDDSLANQVQPVLRFIDLGGCTDLYQVEMDETSQPRPFTPQYAASEVAYGFDRLEPTTASDWFRFGLVVLFTMTRHPPLSGWLDSYGEDLGRILGLTEDVLYNACQQADFDASGISASLRRYMERLMLLQKADHPWYSLTLRERQTFLESIHPIHVQSLYPELGGPTLMPEDQELDALADMLASLLSPNPKLRIHGPAVIKHQWFSTTWMADSTGSKEAPEFLRSYKWIPNEVEKYNAEFKEFMARRTSKLEQSHENE